MDACKVTGVASVFLKIQNKIILSFLCKICFFYMLIDFAIDDMLDNIVNFMKHFYAKY